jgi:periplasmic protein TonB
MAVERFAGLAMVAALHAAGLYWLWSVHYLPSAAQPQVLMVNLISPQTPSPPVPPPRTPQAPPPKAPVPQPPAQQERSPASMTQATQPVVAAAAPEPAAEAPRAAAHPAPPAPPVPQGPLTLEGELAVSCPERTAPAYPALSRRLGETGKVTVLVELDETGAVASARVSESSGYTRLDEAALSAVRSWRCNPARRGAQAVRALAYQPFKFLVQGH